MTHPHLSPTRGLTVGLDVLFAVLIVVAVVQAPSGTMWAAALSAGLFAAVYAWGRVAVRVHERTLDSPRGGWWPDAAWITALTAVWAVLLWLSPAALWIAFPIMLLQMHVLGPHRGPIAVLVTTLAGVTEGVLVQASPGDPWTGFVLGPVLGAGVAVGVVLGIEAFVRESQNRQRTVDELTQARRHLAQAERDRAITEERARLGRDIHDTLAQSLSAIELLLRTAENTAGTDNEQTRTLIGQAREAARDGLGEARRVVQDLTPGDLERTTLLDALYRVAERTANTYNDTEIGRSRPLSVSVHTNGVAVPLPVPLETALLRIAQSALANVTEHAEATRAQVTLTYEPDLVALDVVDDGNGFDPAIINNQSGERGFGIPAIRSRIQALGGTFALETAPGNGTALAVTVPVRLAEESR